MQKDVWVIERCSIHVHFSATVDPVLKAGRNIFYGKKKENGIEEDFSGFGFFSDLWSQWSAHKVGYLGWNGSVVAKITTTT